MIPVERGSTVVDSEGKTTEHILEWNFKLLEIGIRILINNHCVHRIWIFDQLFEWSDSSWNKTHVTVNNSACELEPRTSTDPKTLF